MPRPGAPSAGAPPRPTAPKPAAKPLVRSYTPLKLEVQQAAKELVVDDFVDHYFRERPKTMRGPRLDELPMPPAPPSEPHGPASEESGIRALGGTRDDIELSIAEHEEDLIALEARLADRDEHIESMQGEMLRLQMELETLRRQRASSRPPTADVDASAPTFEPLATIPTVAADVSATPPAGIAPLATPPTPLPRGALARETPTGSRSSTIRIVVGAAVAIVAAGVVAVFALRLTGRASSVSTPTAVAAPTSRPAAPAKTNPSSDEKPAPTTEPSPPGPSAKPTPISPQPTGEVPVGGLSPASDVEESGLLSFQAHLTVHSDIDAEVVVQGQPVGRTNQKLLVRCGPRNVRIRDDRGWRSAGEHVRITCMHAVTIPIRATP